MRTFPTWKKKMHNKKKERKKKDRNTEIKLYPKYSPETFKVLSNEGKTSE